eukprot:GDKH01010623.1.p2 GENE.GDKH01010623.1~~GDKH01010623.1.p2  ORF type:complete len:86 (+),score=3.08 GDKH01010623.1:153-410(+)
MSSDPFYCQSIHKMNYDLNTKKSVPETYKQGDPKGNFDVNRECAHSQPSSETQYPSTTRNDGKMFTEGESAFACNRKFIMREAKS